MQKSPNYRARRLLAYAFTTICIMAIPFIRINGNQIFLLSFDKKQLHLLGAVFEVQELYLMPFLLIMLFVGIFLLTSLAGRFWCGWACPHTIFRTIYRDFIETKLLRLRRSSENKQTKTKLDSPAAKAKKALAIALWMALSLIAASNFLWYFVPPSDFFAYLGDYKNHGVLVGFLVAITLFLTLEIPFVQEVFCIYICPYCRVQSVLYDNDTKTVMYDLSRGSAVYKNGAALPKSEITGECISCLKCVHICPTHIDIRKGLQLECINCLECADACASVMGKLNKASLVRWSSKNALNAVRGVRYFRAKTIAYMAVIALVAGIAVFLSSTKSNMLLNINRTSESYTLLENGAVENHYIMLFQNTSNAPHDYYFRVLGNERIQIRQPAESFTIKPGEKVRKRVFLMADSPLPDAITPITIEAYALDDEKIRITKESVFASPQK